MVDWDGRKLPLEWVKWPCLQERGHFQQLSTDGFRGTCLGNEDIWDNFPCGLQPVSLLPLVCVTAARQACVPWAAMMAGGPAGTWPTIPAHLEGAFNTLLGAPG